MPARSSSRPSSRPGRRASASRSASRRSSTGRCSSVSAAKRSHAGGSPSGRPTTTGTNTERHGDPSRKRATGGTPAGASSATTAAVVASRPSTCMQIVQPSAPPTWLRRWARAASTSKGPASSRRTARLPARVDHRREAGIGVAVRRVERRDGEAVRDGPPLPHPLDVPPVTRRLHHERLGRVGHQERRPVAELVPTRRVVARAALAVRLEERGDDGDRRRSRRPTLQRQPDQVHAHQRVGCRRGVGGGEHGLVPDRHARLVDAVLHAPHPRGSRARRSRSSARRARGSPGRWPG